MYHNGADKSLYWFEAMLDYILFWNQIVMQDTASSDSIKLNLFKVMYTAGLVCRITLWVIYDSIWAKSISQSESEQWQCFGSVLEHSSDYKVKHLTSTSH